VVITHINRGDTTTSYSFFKGVKEASARKYIIFLLTGCQRSIQLEEVFQMNQETQDRDMGEMEIEIEFWQKRKRVRAT